MRGRGGLTYGILIPVGEVITALSGDVDRPDQQAFVTSGLFSLSIEGVAAARRGVVGARHQYVGWAI
jgi:hypothetical protein